MFAGDGIPPGALQLVYGPNEAGKSTALRAISGLLFGIPAQTPDAHVHRMGDLRVGAVLEGTDGTVVEVVRRKGNKNTLLDAEGKVLDDGLVRRLCGAATEATFSALFGLDHVSLREGAAALLAGKGNVGESLFDAALGRGRGIRRVLDELTAEADELFAKQAQKRKLNESIRAYQEARMAVITQAKSGEAWLKQTEALKDARAERERLAALVRERRRELHRVERARRLLPVVAHREHLLGRVANLGEVLLLPLDAAKVRETALHDRRQAAEEVARLEAEIVEKTERRERLVVPVWLDHPAVTGLAELPSRLGAHRKAAEDRPRLAAMLVAREAEAETLAAELPGGAVPRGASTPAVVLGVAEQTRIRTLSLSETAVVQAQVRASRTCDERERRWCARRDEMAALPPELQEGGGAGGTDALRKLLARVQQEGDLQQRRRVAEVAHQRLAADLDRRLATLGVPELAPERLVALAVPAPESVERFARDSQALTAREERFSDEASTLHRRAYAVERKMSELTSTGQVPSLETLATARDDRTASWGRLSAARKGESATWTELAGHFERTVARADDAADRLLREADRVANATALAAERDEVASLLRDTEAQQVELARRREEATTAWRALWAPVGVGPGPPEEMRGWLRRLGEAVEAAGRLDAAASEVTTLDERIQTALSELRAAIRVARAGDNTAAEDAARREPAPLLGALCERVAGVAQAREDDSRKRVDLARDLAVLESDLAGARRELEEAEAALDAWRRAWADAVAPLGLRPEASAAEATAVLDVAGALARKHDEVADMRRRIASIDRDATRLEQSVRELVGALAPDLADRPFEEAARTIVQRHGDGVQAARERVDVDRELLRRREAQRAAELACAAAEERLRELMRKAGAASVTDLEEAERRSTEALQLRRQVGDSEDQILVGADGLTLEAALTETHGATAEELDERISKAHDELEDLESETQRANQTIGSVQEGLRLLEESGAAAAADSASEAQSHLARVRTLAEQYARLRIAARLLSGEIERYREEHQGPVLTRAGSLLARLTLGHYTGLRADFDDGDSPVLRCLRADGAKVGVDDLSDGTRDQLFLALRLATLETQAAASEPMPLILDDILIHFDDERAGAALGVLADHAGATQVVLFTHHARIVDIAQRAVPPPQLRVLNLEG